MRIYIENLNNDIGMSLFFFYPVWIVFVSSAFLKNLT